MIPTQTVMLYGNSLVVSTIGASLHGCREFQVQHVDPARPDAKRRLSDLQPNILIFDLAIMRPEVAIRLWKTQPHLLLIGIDLAADRMIILSDRSTRALTTSDLLRVIESHAGDAAHRGASRRHGEEEKERL
jgi:hypothetical protein